MKRISFVCKILFAVISVAAIAAAAALCAFAATAQRDKFYDILITVGRDETSRNLTWQSQEKGTRQSVTWARARDLVDTEFPAGARTLEVEAEGGMTYRALLDGLEPDTEYAYRISSDAAGRSPVYTFRTGSAGDGRFSFLLAGDPQIGGCILDIDTENWNVAMQKTRNWFGRDVEFMLTAGDQIDTGTNEVEFDYFSYPEWLRSLTLMSVPGNHDNTYYYSKFFTYTGIDSATVGDAGKYGGDYWAAYDGCLFVNINCNDLSLALHRDFIARAVEEYTALYGEPNWKIGSMHFSSYSAAAGRWDSAYRHEYAPIFVEYGFDAVLSGHDHVYNRTYMMDAAALPDDDPAHYTAVGGDPFGSIIDPAEGTALFMTANSASGSKLYPLAKEELPWVAKKSQENVPYITKVDVTADSLIFTTYRTSVDDDIDAVVDFFAIHHRKGAGSDTDAPFLTVPEETVVSDPASFDLMRGVTAYDNFDGDLTASVKVTGAPRADGATYATYTVTDSAGNTAIARRKLIPAGVETPVESPKSNWRYIDSGELPFDLGGADYYGWTAPDYDDSSWTEGAAPFGCFEEYPAGSEHKTLPFVTELNLYYPEGSEDEGYDVANYFFRCTFDLSDPEGVDRIVGRMRLDDAAEIYINGVKITAFSLPTTPYVPWGYSGIYDPGGVAKETSFTVDDPAVIASLGLKKTGNVIAVELYQGTMNSSDIFFEMPWLTFTVSNAEHAMPFADVPRDSWYHDNVARAFANGLFAGVASDRFDPSGYMTRAMAWRVLSRLACADLPGGSTWYESSRLWAMERGVSDGSYPHDALTREQFAVMLYGLAGNPPATGDLSGFTDRAGISDWAEDGVSWAVGRGLMVGRDGARLAPGEWVTRAEACTIITKYGLD